MGIGLSKNDTGLIVDVGGTDEGVSLHSLAKAGPAKSYRLVVVIGADTHSIGPANVSCPGAVKGDLVKAVIRTDTTSRRSALTDQNNSGTPFETVISQDDQIVQIQNFDFSAWSFVIFLESA